MKIAFFEVFDKEEQDFLNNQLPDGEIKYYKEKLTEGNISSVLDIEVLSVFRRSKVDRKVIDTLSNLKFINACSTGYDNIDVLYAHEKGIKVSNVPAYGSRTVAEFAFALLLSLSRRITDANNVVRGEGFEVAKFQGFDLFGKTLGVVGTGKIGKNVIEIAKGFGMNVVATDLYPDLKFAEENNFEYKSLEEVLAISDVVTIHAPYTKENHHLINNESISKIKRGAYLINTSRGALVDKVALLRALEEGAVGGAGLDVFDGEEVGGDSPFIGLPHVVNTPHIAFNTKEAKAEMIRVTAENIKAFISGVPINLIK